MAATPAATRSYFERHSIAVPPVVLGRTGLVVSPVGFGGYRVTDRNAGHRRALTQALTQGCNLIDTSTNYTNGGSERLVGETLASLFRDGKLKRDEIVLVSKVGYVQGDNLVLAQDHEANGQPFPDMVKVSDDCWHCISPEFLKDQLTRSLARLQLNTIDVLLLHNPEYFLKVEGNHSEYYRRIRAAFEYLETEVAQGRIRWYGISSNSFPDPKESQDYTSLESVLELAGAIGPENHFAVIQFPFNLYEQGAALEQSNSGKTVAELASRKLGTLINRPLNAFAGTKLVRLADFPSHHGEDVGGRLKETLQKCMDLEGRYGARDVVAPNRIAWGHLLRENIERLSELDTWKQALPYQILPSLGEAYRELSEKRADQRDWIEQHRRATAGLFTAFTHYLEAEAAMRSHRLSTALDAAVPELATSRTLSRKALRICRSLPGFHCILVGMRQTDYVDDALAFEPALSAERAFDALDAIELNTETTH